MPVLRTLQQTWVWFSEQCCETGFMHWGTAQLDKLPQTPRSFGSRAWEHNPSTVPKPRHLLCGLLCLYVTLAFENFLFSLRHCWFIWASSFGKRGTCLSLQRCLMWERAQMSCRRLSMAHGSCKRAREKKICCHCVEASLAVLEKFFLFPSSISRPFSQGRSAKMEILV